MRRIVAVRDVVVRVIEYGEIQRVGGSETLRVDVRIVGSTNADLPELAAALTSALRQEDDLAIGNVVGSNIFNVLGCIGLTGLAVTKLDGTAKGGILFSIASTLKLPVRFIGVGEGIDDLRPFNASEFVDALLD